MSLKKNKLALSLLQLHFQQNDSLTRHKYVQSTYTLFKAMQKTWTV